LLIPDKFDNPATQKAMTGFLQWMLTTGQKDAGSMGYAPLPAKVAKAEEAQIAKIK
jgi:ABC-type phosphate transport system substrate-binding protein